MLTLEKIDSNWINTVSTTTVMTHDSLCYFYNIGTTAQLFKSDLFLHQLLSIMQRCQFAVRFMLTLRFYRCVHQVEFGSLLLFREKTKI